MLSKEALEFIHQSCLHAPFTVDGSTIRQITTVLDEIENWVKEELAKPLETNEEPHAGN